MEWLAGKKKAIRTINGWELISNKKIKIE